MPFRQLKPPQGAESVALRAHSVRISLWRRATLEVGAKHQHYASPCTCHLPGHYFPSPPPPPPRVVMEFRSSGTNAGASGLPTNNGENLPVDVGLDIDAAAAFRVVSATEAGDIHHTALVDVHHTGCEGRETEVWLRLVQVGPGWGLQAAALPRPVGAFLFPDFRDSPHLAENKLPCQHHIRRTSLNLSQPWWVKAIELSPEG